MGLRELPGMLVEAGIATEEQAERLLQLIAEADDAEWEPMMSAAEAERVQRG